MTSTPNSNSMPHLVEDIDIDNIDSVVRDLTEPTSIHASADEMRAELASLKSVLVQIWGNAKQARKEGWGNVISRGGELMTSSEARIRRAEEDAKVWAKKRELEEKMEQRAQKAANGEAPSSDRIFTGSLSSKNRGELLAILKAFGVQLTKRRPRARTLRSVQWYFYKHPELRMDPRFIGMFKDRLYICPFELEASLSGPTEQDSEGPCPEEC